MLFIFFFFNDTATTEIYTYGHTLSLHDALPIYAAQRCAGDDQRRDEGGQLGVDRVHALEVAGAVLGQRSVPAADAGLVRAASQAHHLSQVGCHRVDQRLVGQSESAVVAVATY